MAATLADARAAGHLFDVRWLNGHDVTGLALSARQNLLCSIPFRLPLARVAQVAGAAPSERPGQRGGEGVMAKMTCDASRELVVGGFTDSKGSRIGLGALLVGYFDGVDFVFAGKVGTGLDTGLLRALRAELDPLRIAAPLFTRGTGLPRVRAHWVRPRLVVQVAFTEWTVHGKLRQPRLLGVRRDQAAGGATRERA